MSNPSGQHLALFARMYNHSGPFFLKREENEHEKENDRTECMFDADSGAAVEFDSLRQSDTAQHSPKSAHAAQRFRSDHSAV